MSYHVANDRTTRLGITTLRFCTRTRRSTSFIMPFAFGFVVTCLMLASRTGAAGVA